MTAEIERFLADARSNAGLQAEIAQTGDTLDALVGVANARGYKINRADVDAYIAARKSEMSDDQLDQVAGGGHKKHKDGISSWFYNLGTMDLRGL
jgi:predicted ribosomally synthesized peptide with nif11-like leader